MTEVSFPETFKTSGWRYRYCNRTKVYSIDHDDDYFSKQQISNDDVGRTIVNEFVRNASCNTAIHEWCRNNPFVAEHLCVGLVACDSLTYEEKHSVRNITSRGKDCELRLLSKFEPSEFSFNVLVLRIDFCDRLTRKHFFEYCVLGVIARRNASTITLSEVLLTCENNQMDAASRKALADLRLPRVNIRPFGSETASTADTAEENRLISFFVRWHVARKSPRENTFYDKVIGAPPLKSAEEFDAQLFSHTVKYFVDCSAAEWMLSCQDLPNKLLAMWNNNQVSLQRRSWMIRQLCDAVDYCIEHHVVARGQTAMRFFVKNTLLPALAFFTPQISVQKTTATTIDIDFCSPSRSSLQFRINNVLTKYKPLLQSGEPQHVFVDNGNLVIPTSVACRMFVDVFKCALDKLAATTAVDYGRRQSVWLVDDTVMPVQGGDLYVRNRTTRYDDYPVGGFYYKLITSSNNMSNAATNDPLAEAFKIFNLPVEAEMANSENSKSTVSATESGASIPLYKSGSYLSVSRDALHDVCSNQTTVDIEDIATTETKQNSAIDDENPCTTLHNNYALPLCVRVHTQQYVETNQHLLYKQRWFVYRFFESLHMDDITHEKITEFMLVNSTSAELRSRHKREIDAFPKSLKKWTDKQIQDRIDKGETEDKAKQDASCFGGCRKQIEDKICPYYRVATLTAEAEEELRKMLKSTNSLLKTDDEAIDRIIAQLKRTKISQVGCLQEYVETRRKINIDVEPKTASDLSISKPKHYVYACADFKQRCDCK